MPIFYLVTAFLLAMAVHEFAHGAAMRRLGAPIVRAGLGLPVPYLTLSLPTPWGWHLTLSPLLVGAYVECDEDGQEVLDALSYRDQAWYMNAGILANLLLAEAAIAVELALGGRWIGAALAGAVGAATWLLRRPVAAFALPVLSLPALGFTGYVIVSAMARGENPVGVVAPATALAPQAAAAPALFVAAVSVSLAVLNSMPLMGLDNGRVVALVLARWLSPRALTAYKLGGAAAVVLLVGASVGSDAVSLIGGILP